MESVHNKLVFWPYWTLAHEPRIELVPLALEVQSLNHWTAKEVSKLFFFFFKAMIIHYQKNKIYLYNLF